MKPLARNAFPVEVEGITFSLLMPSALTTLALRRILPREDETDTTLIAARSALVVAYLWDPASVHGALDCAAALPPLAKATAEELEAAGALALAELSEAGMSFTMLTALFIGGLRTMFGSNLAEGGKTATFTGARPG